MISAPEDYGMTPEQTLSHRCTSARPERYEAFWTAFREEVAALPVRWTGSIEPGSNELTIRSIGDVRIVARVIVPAGTPRGIVVTTHGYVTADTFDSDADRWSSLGLVVVHLRVRGFPPSVHDTGDRREQWILHGLGSDEQWVLRGAVADLVHTCRCARAALNESLPLVLHGESFGAGLAVIAAAQLAAMDAAPLRLVLGHPTFGDWAWRLGRYCNGAGAQVNMIADTMHGADRDAFVERLLLFDAALHASDVRVPVLCKLAQCDDVVPAPSAAAVFNALESDPACRFITSYGHFDGGLADLRRHAQFERLHPAFADPDRDPRTILPTEGNALDVTRSTSAT